MQENEAVQEEKKKQLYEEGIDAILARAEVCNVTHVAIHVLFSDADVTDFTHGCAHYQCFVPCW